MMSHLSPAIALTLFFAFLTGLAYPVAVTGIAQGHFPAAANGGLSQFCDLIVAPL